MVVLHRFKVSLILKMNITDIIVANAQNPLVTELLEEVDLVIQLQQWIATIDCKDVFIREMHRSKYMYETLKEDLQINRHKVDFFG